MLGLGLLSTARIALEILEALPAQVEAVAVASRDAARAETYAREHGLARSHGTYEALLADPEVDAIYIPLPNGLHHEWTMRSLRAGKHVLCEKPYSRRPAEVEEAFDLAEESGLVLMEAFMYRHHPQTELVADLVASGGVGWPRMVTTEFSFELSSLDDIRASPELDGGALMDIGCYCVSGLRLICGEPELATAEQRVGPTGVDMSLSGTLRFPDSTVGVLRCSFEAPRSQGLEIVGDGGRLRVEAPWRVDWGGAVRHEIDGQTNEIAVPEASSYRRQLENFAAAVAGAAAPLLGRADALGQARAIDALYRSADEGRVVTL